MTLSPYEFQDLVKKIKSQNAETAEIDVKEDLQLITEGDKAFFIRHIAALANNVVPGYLLIGIQDKSWEFVGLPPESSLREQDQTQNQMNQILEHKLDPQISIQYRIFDYESTVLGLVIVEGVRAPYIVAINESDYGGNRTKGEPTFIHRGAIYFRHGDRTVILNRQSRLLEIIDQSSRTLSNPGNEFLIKNNYLDIEAEDYGSNSLSKDLAEVKQDRRSSIPAKSWVSLLFTPVNGNCDIDTASLPGKVQLDNRIGREGQWFHGLPRPIMDMLSQAHGSPRMFSGFWSPWKTSDSDEYTHAIEILPTGEIHLVVTYPLFFERQFESYTKEIRFYGFVNLIGYLWQLTYFARAVYKDAGYHGEVKVVLNLIGSGGTFLSDLAKGKMKWVTFGDWEYSPSDKEIAKEENICIERTCNIIDEDDAGIEILIRDMASELGKYFGQETPKCYTPDDDQFPVDCFLSKNG